MDEFAQLIQSLKSQNASLATAESCTGGYLGKLLTDVPGASAVYLGGVVSYAYGVKERLLQVDARLLEEKGAVCPEVALQMAQGVRQLLGADYAMSTTGNAGPGTDPLNPNVGEIYISAATPEQTVWKKLELHGSREENRQRACLEAARLLNSLL